MSVIDNIKRGWTKFFYYDDSEKSASEYVKPGPSSAGLEAKLESDYNDLHAAAASVQYAESSLESLDMQTETETEIETESESETTESFETLSYEYEEVATVDEGLHTGGEYVGGEDTEGGYMDREYTDEKETVAVTQYEEPTQEEEPKRGNSLSHISEEAVVSGDIATEGHIEVLGKVKGNIEAKGNVAIQGDIKGNIVGSKIGLYSCKIKGNLKAAIGVIADTSSLIIGDIIAESVILDGRLKGDVQAENIVIIKENGYYLGDIVTGALSVENGAIINGNVRTLVDGDVEAPFDD